MSEEERVTGQEAVAAGGRMVGYIFLIVVVLVVAFGSLSVLIAPLVP